MSKLDSAVSQWLDEVSRQNKLPESCRAIVIGLFQGVDNYQMYISGSDVYDANDEDWACNQDFTPEPRYLDSGVPTAKVRWDRFLQDAVAAVRSAMDHSKTILSDAPHVSVGFDDGNLVNLK